MAAPELSAGTSLRERKKARTRAALIEVSQRRFAQGGYAATTLEEICAEVEVRPQTLLRYFPSKADLAMAPWFDWLDVLRAQLAVPRRRSTIEVWRDFLTAECHALTESGSEVVGNMITGIRASGAWADQDPVLVAMFSDLEHQYQQVLAAALAADRGVPPDDLHSLLVAAMLVVGRRAVFGRWVAREGEPSTPSLVDDQLAVVDYAVMSLPRRSARRLLAIAAR